MKVSKYLSNVPFDDYEVIEKSNGKGIRNAIEADDSTGEYLVEVFDSEKDLFVAEKRHGDIAIVRKDHEHKLIFDKCAIMYIGNEQKMIDHYKCIHCYRWVFKARDTDKQVDFDDKLRGVEIKD